MHFHAIHWLNVKHLVDFVACPFVTFISTKTGSSLSISTQNKISTQTNAKIRLSLFWCISINNNFSLIFH